MPFIHLIAMKIFLGIINLLLTIWSLLQVWSMDINGFTLLAWIGGFQLVISILLLAQKIYRSDPIPLWLIIHWLFILSVVLIIALEYYVQNLIQINDCIFFGYLYGIAFYFSMALIKSP